MTEPDAVLHELTHAECEQLLTTVPIGRVGLIFAARPVILPVNFEFVDGEVMIRTFRGQKFGAAQAHQHVAFEIDDWDAELRTGWSVLVKGRAETVVEWAKARAADDLELEPYAHDDGHDPWIRIIPDNITGRRIAV